MKMNQINRRKEDEKRSQQLQYASVVLAKLSTDYNDHFNYNVDVSDGVDDDDEDNEDLQKLDAFMDKEEDEIDEDENENKNLYNQQQYQNTLHSFKFYEPSDELKAAQINDFNEESMLAIDNATYCRYLKTRETTADQVHIILKMLLTIEDLTCLIEYVPLTLKNVSLIPCGIHSYTVNLENTNVNAENIVDPLMDNVILVPMASKLSSVPAKDSIDYLMPHPHEFVTDFNINRPTATVEQISQDKVMFRFEKDKFPRLYEKVLNQRFDIIFRPQRRPFRYQYRALELLSFDPGVRRYIFPINNPNKIPPVYANLNLINQTIASNSEQLQAVQQIVEGPNAYAPYVIFGPPGTGKTTTIVEAILQLRLQRPRSRILVTAGSNAACDTIALRICQYFKSSPVLQLHMAQQKKQASIFTLDVDADCQIIRIYSKAGYMKSKESIDPLLLANSNCRGGEHCYMGSNAIREYGIIVATLCSVGALVTANVGKFNYFTHIFIDEAGASTEPEALVGIMGIKTNDVCRVVLSGDHKQLGPVLKSKRAAQLGLERSMLERLLNSPCYAIDKNGNYDRTLQTRLRRNYRSHSEIVRLYNELYYNNELLAEALSDNVNIAAKWSHILPNPDFPIIFQATHGKTERKPISPSLYNTLEVEQVLWYVRRIICDGYNAVQISDIGIISPYRAQCKRISDTLEEHMIFGIEVGSVEMFQGREKPIIIVSLVRSFAGFGFVNNPRRLNVILSRAKSLLVLIGNPKTLSRNDNFRYIISECSHKGTFLYKNHERSVFNFTIPTTKKTTRNPINPLRILKHSETRVVNTATEKKLNSNKKIILSLQKAFERHTLKEVTNNCSKDVIVAKEEKNIEQLLLFNKSNALNTHVFEESNCEPMNLKENQERSIIRSLDVNNDNVLPILDREKIKKLIIEHAQIIEIIERNIFQTNQQTTEVENLQIVDENYNLNQTDSSADHLNILNMVLYHAKIIKNIQNKFALSNDTHNNNDYINTDIENKIDIDNDNNIDSNNNSLMLAPMVRTLKKKDFHFSELVYHNKKHHHDQQQQKQQLQELTENLENNPNVANLL